MHRDLAACVATLAALAAILRCSAPVFAANPDGIPVSTAAGDQLFPVTVSDGAGGTIVAWHDGSNGRCYAQRLSAAGIPLWTAGGVQLSSTADASEEVVIVADGAGGAFLAFDGSSTPPRAQRVNASGVPQWGADGVQLTNNLSATRHLAIAPDLGGTGGAFVAWRSDLGSGGTSDVYAQKLNSSGALQWGSQGIAVAATNMNSEGNPAILSDGVGGAIFAWINPGVRARRLNSAGAEVWQPVILASTGNNMPPSMASDGAGGAIIAWSGGGAFIQCVNSSGDRIWNPASGGFSLSTTGRAPTVIGDGAGGAIVAWEDSRAPTNFNLYAQKLNQEGATQWMVNGSPFCTATDDQRAPRMVSDGAGGGIIAWYDARNGASGWDIYAQRIDGNGASLWTLDGVPVSTASNSQDFPTIAIDGGGGAWISWQDLRSGTHEDVYASHVSSGGTVLAVPNERSATLQAHAWPDPFVDRVHLSFALPAAARVRMAVYGVDGRAVADLGAATLSAGAHKITWDGRTSDGRPAGAGLYFLRVQGPGIALTRSVVRLR